jgi:hypothetical protein
VQDFATVRALYEYAMEHYHSKAFSDASALFEVLAGITDDESFSLSLEYHLGAAKNEIDLDTFLTQYADIDKTEQNSTFYISFFQQKAQELLKLDKNGAE